jgi:signal transduction histidine kinase
MLELYNLTLSTAILCSILLLIAIALQTARLFFLQAHTEHKTPGSIFLYELAVLAHLVMAIFLLTITLSQQNIIAEHLHILRWISLFPVILGLWITRRHNKFGPLLSSLLLLPILPFCSIPYAHYYFVASALYFTFRSVIMWDLERNRVKKSITKLSIKEAVDLFPGGILYATEKGSTLIVNPTMEWLINALDIPTIHNALDLWENLMLVKDDSNISLQALDEKLLIRIRNGGSWLFSMQTAIVNTRKYLQLLALDITEEDVLTKEIEESNLALEAAGQEIGTAIISIRELEKEREILRMKSTVHDILGQRLSILNRLLDGELNAEEIAKELKPLLTDLTQAITKSEDPPPKELLSDLTYSFSLIGTTIDLQGNLPGIPTVAGVFAKIIRECATNAVRHGGAKHVYVEFLENENTYFLSIQNDGTLPSGPVVDGGGIAGIRRKIGDLQGTLKIMVQPLFSVLISVPKTEDDCND